MAFIASSLLFLFGAPALILWMGKLIQGIGRKRPLAASRVATEAWYYRPVQPVFAGRDPTEHGRPAAAPASSQNEPWYNRPTSPVFTRPSWLRRPTFAGHGTD